MGNGGVSREGKQAKGNFTLLLNLSSKLPEGRKNACKGGSQDARLYLQCDSTTYDLHHRGQKYLT